MRPLVTAVLLAAAAAAGAEATFETALDMPVEAVLPPALLHSPHYSIEPEVNARENFYHFSVTTDSATYEVTSVAMLRKRLYEIATIAEVEPRLADKPASFDRTPGGRRGVSSERVVDIFADPVGTTSQLLGNLQYNVEQTFDETSEEADRPARGPGVRDLDPSPHKRSAAAQLGVDVYSSNVRLQQLLTSVAELRSAGKTRTSFSPFIRNVYAEPSFGSGVFDARLESTIKNTGGPDLNAEIDGMMEELGVPRPTRIAFLTHPAYTPRTRLYFAGYASLMSDVRHLDYLFEAATAARTDADALAYVSYARMLAFYHLQGGRLAEVITQARFPTLATRDGDAVLALPLDYLAWTETVARAADTLHALRTELELDDFVVLLAGTPTLRAADELERRAVTLRPHYSY
ncbi:MAG: hypothetical protein ACU85V_08625 [Gammaproteobacteria bacterium]